MKIDITSLPFDFGLNEYVIDGPLEKILPTPLAVALQLKVSGEPLPFEHIVFLANSIQEKLSAQVDP
tara:strand:- start:44 stop:244 length:201 start_codon:yes stop_codon:yes gene_type:complete